MSDTSNRRKVLILSSMSPYHSANLGMDVFSSLTEGGYEVDFLTRDEQTADFSFVDKQTAPLVKKKSPASKLCLYFKHFIRFHSRRKQKEENKFVIINSDESKAPVNTSLLVSKIDKKYDFVLVLFWQNMLVAGSLKSVYDKLKVPIFILAVDMYPFTGGCFYFWDCRNFIRTSCGKCPGLHSSDENDSTRHNFLVKQKVYQNIPCVFLGNTWMRSYIEKSPIISGRPVRESFLVINESLFKIRDKASVLSDFGFSPNDKRFFIFAGAPSLDEKRKGFIYLAEALKLFSQTLSLGERSQIVLLLAGNATQDIESHFDVQVCQMGFLDAVNLAKVYSMANLYLSPSIEDAGPSMVNQSVMAGTPVVAFNIGVAQDIVLTGETGYRAKPLDSEDFAKGIRYVYSLPEGQRLLMQKKCRELGLKLFSYAVFADKIKEYDREFCR